MKSRVVATKTRTTCGHKLSLLGRILLIVIAGAALLSTALPKTTIIRPISVTSELASGTTGERLGQSFLRLPLAFEKNEGQAASEVRFIARGAGGDVYLSETETILRLINAQSSPEDFADDLQSPKKNLTRARTRVAKGSLREVVKIKLLGSKVRTVTGLEKSPGTVNYFIGSNPRKWHTSIETFERVKYGNVYPGIDQIFYGNGQQLEYDFILSPGANPQLIRFAFAGQKKLTLDASGDLVLQTKASQEVRLHKPVAYQEVNGARQEIAASYVKRNAGGIGFELGPYDHGKPLIIDPIVSYSTYFGGSGNETGFDIAVDATGNSYITGSTDSTELSSMGGTNVFVAKLNPAGTQRTYLAILGGSGNDTGFSIAADSAGSAYVAGATDSPDFPLTNANQLSFGGGSQDGFIAKLNPDGSAVTYATYFGGTGNDTAFGLALDAAGSAYVTGSTDSPEFSTLGNTNAFVTKLTPSGSQRTYLAIVGGSGDDTAFDIAVDGSGAACIVGSTDSSNFTVANALQPNFGGVLDAFVAKLNPSGSALTYSTYLGGSGSDSGFGVAVDNQSNTYITGSTDSPEFSTLGGRDTFVAKFSALGNERSYFTILGGSGDDAGFGIAVDPSGNSYITGSTDSSNFTTADAIQANLGGSQDAFIAKLDAAGSTLSYSTLMGSTSNESGFAIATDGAGGAYVTGFTSSTDFPTVSPLQSANGGSGDAFVLKISGAGTSTPTPTPTPTPSPSPTATPTPSSIQVMLDQSGPAPDQLAALDSILFLRDPFPVVNLANLFTQGIDRNTRVVIFAMNLQLAQGEMASSVVVNLIDTNNQSYDVAAEDVRSVPSSDFTQVIFRLPNNLAVGTCTIKVKAHGQVSNSGTIRIRI